MKFPESTSVPIKNPINFKVNFKTLIFPTDDLGKEIRKRKMLYPKRDYTLVCRGLTKTQGAVLWDFYNSCYGKYEGFNLFVKHSATYSGEYVGTGDGSTVLFNLPSRDASSYTIYSNGIEQTETTNYTFGSNGGEDGADKVTFVVAPANGVRITYDFFGYLKVRSRFAEDYQEFEIFLDRIVSAGLQMKGLLNDQ